jgi:RNA polymerase sigma factor (sigma-70 family)
MNKPPFEEVLSRHGALVLRVSRAAVGEIDADDVWSDTFLSALEAYPRLHADANIEAWLVTIAHNKAIDLLRKNRRVEAVGEVPLPGTLDDQPDLDLLRDLAALPEKQRLTVAYHYLAGLTYREIAALLGGTEAAARRAAADGIARLRTSQGVTR